MVSRAKVTPFRRFCITDPKKLAVWLEQLEYQFVLLTVRTDLLSERGKLNGRIKDIWQERAPLE
jgi:hypothetical protein